MALADGTLFVLTAVLFFGLVVPQFFKKFQLPFATSLIIVGSIAGPHGLNYIQINESLELFGFLGAAFLLLLAGLNAKSIHFDQFKEKIIIMAGFNGFIPFIVGLTIARIFGYSWHTSIFLAIVFISSSVALIFSNIKILKLEKTHIGQIATSIAILEDIISLFLLSLILKESSSGSRFPLLIYLGLLISSVILLKMFLPEIAKYLFKLHKKKRDEYEVELRTVISLLLVVLIIFSGLGIHPILAAFLVGFVLAEIIKTNSLQEKLHTIGYGIFVPIFFFIVGMQINLSSLLKFENINIFMISIVLGLLISKFISGFLSAKLNNFSLKHSLIFGSLTMSQLTTTLSTTYAAAALNIIDNLILTSVAVTSIISTIVSPALCLIFSKYFKGDNHN